MPLLNEQALKADYTASGAYAIYNTNSVERYTKTQNPLAAVWALSKYYHRLPKAALKEYRGKPVESEEDWKRPLNKFVRLAGLYQGEFGKLASWRSGFTRYFQLRDIRKDFVEVKVWQDLKKELPHLKAALDKKEPVMWIREGTGEFTDLQKKLTHGDKPFPLTIALIDGYNDEGKIHIVWPKGWDRRYKTIKSGWFPVDDDSAFYDVKNSFLVYWRP